MGAVPYKGEVEPITSGAQPYRGDIDPLEHEPSYASRAWESAKPAVTATLGGAALGAGAYFTRGALRRAFPGMMPTTSALKKIDAAIRKSDSSSGLKDMFGKYLWQAGTQRKPISFADFMAQQSGHANAVETIKDLVGQSGNIPNIAENLEARTAGAKSRVLSDISSALGIPQKSIVTGRDDLIAARSSKAKPLYDAAFADTQPIRHSDFFKLFEAPAARRAINEAVTNAENKLQPIETRSAAVPGKRRDWWKRASTDDIPEGLFLDEEPTNGLRRYIAPNLANADEIQKSIYQQMKDAMVTDKTTGYEKHTPKSLALKDLHKQFMDTLYKVSPNDQYRAARDAYSGDSKILDAHKVGSDLLKMSPDEARKAINGMAPDEREALSSGFYGALNDMQHQTFLRQLIARPERYPERRDLLGAVFPDKAKLRDFLDHLGGEQTMADSANVYGNPPPSKDAGARAPWVRAYDIPTSPAHLKISIGEKVSDLVGWPSQRAARAGTDIAFRPADIGPATTTHPDIERIMRTSLGGREIGRDLGNWSSAGALGGLGTYGLGLEPDAHRGGASSTPDPAARPMSALERYLDGQ